jgi:hypothetical protein
LSYLACLLLSLPITQRAREKPIRATRSAIFLSILIFVLGRRQYERKLCFSALLDTTNFLHHEVSWIAVGPRRYGRRYQSKKGRKRAGSECVTHFTSPVDVAHASLRGRENRGRSANQLAYFVDIKLGSDLDQPVIEVLACCAGIAITVIKRIDHVPIWSPP